MEVLGRVLGTLVPIVAIVDRTKAAGAAAGVTEQILGDHKPVLHIWPPPLRLVYPKARHVRPWDGAAEWCHRRLDGDLHGKQRFAPGRPTVQDRLRPYLVEALQ
eukprot:scaffold3884_cov392-Prasinococcus_capsulatus_cf.AAC.2